MMRPARLSASLLSLAGLAAGLGVMLVAGPGSAAPLDCPDSDPRNMRTVAAGSPKTAQLEKPFQTNLQMALANSNGCPLTGRLGRISVDFSAPANGAGGTFAGSGSNRVAAGTDATGIATAPTFTASDVAGSYSVHADSDHGSVKLYLANTTSGVPASITAVGQINQEANVNSQNGQPLRAQVLDANGRPVQGRPSPSRWAREPPAPARASSAAARSSPPTRRPAASAPPPPRPATPARPPTGYATSPAHPPSSAPAPRAASRRLWARAWRSGSRSPSPTQMATRSPARS